MAHYAQPLTRDLDQGPPHHHVLEAQQRRSQRARDQAMMLQMETLAENLCEQFASYYKALPPTATITTSTSSHPSIPTTTTQHPKTGNASPQLAVIPAPPVISTDMIREHVLMMQEQFEAAILAHDAANSSSGGTPMPPAGGGGGAMTISSGRLKTEKDPWPLGQQIAPRPPPTPPVVRRQRLANQAQQQEGTTTTTATSATAVLSPRIPVSLQTRRVLGGSSSSGGVDGQYATNPFPLPPPSTTTYRPQGNSSRRRQPLPAPNNNDEDDDDAPPAMIARADIDAELLAPVVAMSQVADLSKQNFSASASPALKAQLSVHETRSPRQRSENFRLLDCLLDGNTVCISQRKRKELSAVEQSLRDGAKFAPLPATVLEPAYLISSPRSSHYHQATAGSNRDEMRFSNHPSVAGSGGPLTLTGSIGGGVSHSAAASLSTVVAAVKSSNRVATIAKRIREQRPEDGYAKQAEQHEAQLVALEAQKWKMRNGAKPKDWTPRDTVHQQALGRTKRAS